MPRIFWAIVLGFATLAASAAPADADPVGNQLSLQRNGLRTEYRKVTKELATVEESIEESTDTSTVAGNATTIWAVRNAQNDHIKRLNGRREDLKDRISAIIRDYKQLTRKAERHYGELPMWWEERLD